MTVTALDAYNNTATGYGGTLQFGSNDSAAVLPANTTLTAGVGTFSVTLKTAGSRTVTATDSFNSIHHRRQRRHQGERGRGHAPGRCSLRNRRGRQLP